MAGRRARRLLQRELPLRTWGGKCPRRVRARGLSCGARAPGVLGAPFMGTAGGGWGAACVGLGAALAAGCTARTGGTFGVNRTPVAAAGEDRAADPGEVVVLDGSGSSDPDHDVL